jgi:hypothetical protein
MGLSNMSITSPARADRAILFSFWIIMGFMALVATMPLIEEYEAAFLPVVEDFRVTSIEADGAAVILSGDMIKRRDCAFTSLTFYAGDRDDLEAPRERLHVQFLDQPEDAEPSRMPGRQPWGPWRLSRPSHVDAPTIFMAVSHRCHDLWRTTGIYFSAPADALFPPGQGEARSGAFSGWEVVTP